MSLDLSAQSKVDDLSSTNSTTGTKIIRHSSQPNTIQTTDQQQQQQNQVHRQMSSSPSFASASVTAIGAYLKHLFGLNAKTTKRSLSEEAENGLPESIEEWVRQGSDPNEVDDYGYTPLVNACLRGCVRSVKCLLSNKADVNKKAMHGYSPLHAAAQNGFVEIVELLIDNGADLEIKNDDNDTPLMLAVRSEHTSVVDLLCKRGCNMHTHGFDNIDPVEYAINKRNLYLSEVLMKHERQFSQTSAGSVSNEPTSAPPSANQSTTSPTAAAPHGSTSNQQILRKQDSLNDEFSSNVSLTGLLQQQQEEHNRINQIKNDSVFQSD